jgi:hypothetical protein
LTKVNETEKFFISISEAFSAASITLIITCKSQSVTLSVDDANETHSSGFPRDVKQDCDVSTKSSNAATQ